MSEVEQEKPDFKILPHGSRLYWVETDQKNPMIEGEHQIETVLTLKEFEAALRDPGIKTIYIPENALISVEGIKRLCQRNGVSKTIYKGYKKNE